jgi:hypothetical protein
LLLLLLLFFVFGLCWSHSLGKFSLYSEHNVGLLDLAESVSDFQRMGVCMSDVFFSLLRGVLFICLFQIFFVFLN